MNRRGRSIMAGLMVLGALAAIVFGGYWLAKPDQPRRPEFTLPDLRGKPRSISEFDGQVLVINFWATWCAPCREEIPMLVEAQREYAERGLQILGVAIDTRGAAAQFAKEYDINYPVLAAPTEGAQIQDAYTAAGTPAGVLPYTVIVDRQRRITTRVAGALTRARLDKLVVSLLDEPAASAIE